MMLCHVMVAECQLTSCWCVVVIGGRVSSERAETGHDDQTERDQDDLTTHTHTIIMEVKFLDDTTVTHTHTHTAAVCRTSRQVLVWAPLLAVCLISV